MCFDGDVEDRIDIGNGVKPSFPLTITAWINPELFGIVNIIKNDAFWPYYYGVVFGFSSTGQLLVHYGDGGYAAPYSRTSGETVESPISLYEWQHVSLVLNAHRDARIYWNCEEYEFEWSEESTGSGLVYSSANGSIGNPITSGWTAYQGAVDDVRVYNRGLSSDEIASFCQGADLGISINDDPDPVSIGENLAYAIDITNSGPMPSEDNDMTAILSRGVRIMPPVQASQGVCEVEKRTNSVRCELGALYPAYAASVVIRARPNRPGTVSLTATIESEESVDPNLYNNTDVEYTSVKRE
jgi:hypothetical protein